jgi:hypothetical protein
VKYRNLTQREKYVSQEVLSRHGSFKTYNKKLWKVELYATHNLPKVTE